MILSLWLSVFCLFQQAEQTESKALLLVEKELEQELQKIRDSGAPPTPEDLNAYYRIPEGEADLTKEWQSVIQENVDRLLGKGTGKEWIVEWLPVEFEESHRPGTEWPNYQKVKSHLDSIQGLKRAKEVSRKKGASRYPLDFREGAALLFPHAEAIRQGVVCLSYETALRAFEKKPRDASENLITALALADSLKNEPVMLSLLAREACHSIVFDMLIQILPFTDFSPEEWVQLQSQLLRADHRQHYYKAFLGERAITTGFSLDSMKKTEKASKNLKVRKLWKTMIQKDLLSLLKFWEHFNTTDRSYSEYVKQLEESAESFLDSRKKEWNEDFNFVLKELGLQFTHEDLLQLQRSLGSIPNVDEQVKEFLNPENFKKFAKIYASAKSSWDRSSIFNYLEKGIAPFFVTSSVPMYKSAFRRVTTTQAKAFCAAAAIGVERYRRARDSFPEKLQDLVPEFLSELPNDPFVDRPLIYQKISEGFLIYSVGPNQKDDGGDLDYVGERNPEDIGFRVSYR